MSKIVLYGHGMYHTKDGTCVVPENTSITFYSPPGTLIDQTVCNALANQEKVTSDDLEFVREVAFFFNSKTDIPRTAPSTLLDTWPKTYHAGEKVPSYFLFPAEVSSNLPKSPLNYQTGETQTVHEITRLTDLFEQFKGHDLHWAACTFAKDADKNAVGYGYACKLNKTSQLANLYSKPTLSDEEKKAMRAKRFRDPEDDTREQKRFRP